ncbi:hypothetical protein CRYUN_Cryun01aG0218400 [Craigia yunnanensis]
MVSSRQGFPSWISPAAATRVDFEGNVENMLRDGHDDSTSQKSKPVTNVNLSFGERTFSAAGAAFLSAVIVNPLDVAKTRLQAQAAGVPYRTCFETNTMFPELRSSQSCARLVLGSEPVCPPECNRYKGTLDLFYKVIRQEGLARLWRGTNASLALAVPTVGIYMPFYDIFCNSMEEFTTNNAPSLTPYVPLVVGIVARSLACVTCYPVELARTRMQAFKETKSGVKPPGVWKTLVGVINPVMSTNYIQNLQNYRILWTGLSAQLARDVPFSAICWSTLEPIRRKLLVSMGDEADACSILGANFAAGFVAGSIAAAVTCPLDVVKTWRQIEKEPAKALKMTTRQTLREIWREGGIKGLFTGLGPRVARAGPSVGIIISFYEVVKYALHHRLEDHE